MQDSSEFEDGVLPFRSERRLVEETARRQDEYEWHLNERLLEEATMHPDKRLDQLGHEIFKLAIFKGDDPGKAARLAMEDPLRKRVQIRGNLAASVARELDWYAEDCHLDTSEGPIATVEDLLKHERFLLMPRCYDDYRRLSPRRQARAAERQLPSELARRGRFVKRRRDYLRVLVPGRFVMHVSRTTDGMLCADSLTPTGRRQKSARAA